MKAQQQEKPYEQPQIAYVFSNLAIACFGESSYPQSNFHNAPVLKHDVNGSPCKFFLDTGSSVCIISQEALEEFNIQGNIKRSTVIIKGLGGTLKVVGSIGINLQIGKTNIFQDFIVVEKRSTIPGDALLGYCWLAAANISLHPQSDSVYIENERFPLEIPASGWRPSHPHLTHITHPQESTITMPQHFPHTLCPVTTLLAQYQQDENTSTSLGTTRADLHLHKMDTPAKQDDHSGNEIQPKGQHTYKPKHNVKHESSAVMYAATEATVLPFSAQQIPAKVTIRKNGKRLYNGTLISDPSGMLRKNTTIPPGLHTLEDGRTSVHIINTSPAPIKFNKGCPISTVTFTTATPIVHDLPDSVNHTTTDTTSDDTDKAQNDGTTENNHLTFHMTEEKSKTNEKKTVEEALQATTKANPPTRKEYVNAIRELFSEFPSILPTPERPLGRTKLVEHTIDLIEGATPTHLPAYRLPHKKRHCLLEEIEGMKAMDLIEPSHSPWSSPLLLVPKSNGSWRLVVDYRGLNNKTVPQAFPMPTIKSLLNEINREAKLFSSIDLASGFLQVPLEEKSRPYTSFSTPHGHYQFKVTPMGLSNSPITFCRLMTLVLQGIMDSSLLLYMDDVLVLSSSFEEHCKKLREVFGRLQNANLTINPAKCALFQKELIYLGHTVSKDGIRPNDAEIKAVKDFPQPKTQKHIKQFLGLTGFYRAFVPNFGEIANPLTSP